MNRRELLLAAGALFLLATAVIRIAVPDRSRLRPLSVEAFEVNPVPVPAGQTVVRETDWKPPADVYVMGWNPWFGLPEGVRFDFEILIYRPADHTTVFVMGQRGSGGAAIDTWREVNLPAGTGFLVREGQALRLRYKITNHGTDPFEARGATALLYFVPVEGN